MARVGSKVFGNRWRILAGTVALGAASFGIASAALPSSAATTGGSGSTTVVECNSGIVTNGDVQTSSQFVAKVPAGSTLPDNPGDCVVRSS